MKIDAHITKLMPDNSSVKAIASINLDGCFSIGNLRVVSGINGLSVSIPSIKDQNGIYSDIIYATTADSHNQLIQAVIGAYHEAIKQLQDQDDGQIRIQSDSGVAESPQDPIQDDPQLTMM